MFEAILVDIHKNYGLIAVIAVLTLIALIKWKPIIERAYNNIIIKLSGRAVLFSPRSILISKLTYWVDFKIPQLNLEDAGRSLIFKDILNTYFLNFKEQVFKLEGNPEFDDMDRQQLMQHITHCIYTVGEDTKDTLIDEGMPKIVIDKFRSWHNKTLEFALRSMELIAQSPVYKTNKDVICASYLLHVAMLEITIAEAEKTLSDLNGELTGLEYKGITIGE
jgi:hypothetical protein